MSTDRPTPPSWSTPASPRSNISTTSSPSFPQETPSRTETAFPEPQLLTVTENRIVDAILELLNKHGLTSYQPLDLLERLGGII